MGNLSIAADYKYKIINLLLKNNKFIQLVSPKESDCQDIDIIDVMLGGKWLINGEWYTEQGYIFDHDFVDDTVKEKKTFVFVDVDIPSVHKNIFMDFNLYVFVFTDKSLVRLNQWSSPTSQEVKEMGYFATDTYGNRIDALCDCIDETLNENEKIYGLGAVTPNPRNHLSTYRPNNQYYGKCLSYHITNYNAGGDQCGI